jgi:NADH-quinone oxidoreductase subunit J
MVWLFNLSSSYLFFYLILIITSFIIVIVNNPIYSIFYLIVVFINAAIILMLSGIHFLGLVLLIVYLGAVVVLFLFIVMLLNIKVLELRRVVNFYPFISICFINIFIFFSSLNHDFLLNIFSFNLNFFNLFFVDWSMLFYNIGSFKTIAFLMYTLYFLNFILAGFILFVSMLGAIVLTISQTKTIKKQNYLNQIIRTRNSLILNNI